MTKWEPPLSEVLQRAMMSHRGGNLIEADRIYRAILRSEPGYSKVLHLLATLELQRGRYEDAVHLIDKALTLKPDHADALNNRGVALDAMGRQQDALESYDKAL